VFFQDVDEIIYIFIIIGMVNITMEGEAQGINNDPVLTRLKELEDSNNSNAKLLEQMQKEIKDKDERIKTLSADKRKEMEGILSSAIDNWLNSLAGVSEENKSNFRHGICKLAEHADMDNAAWEIVCHASQNHKSNVLRIEELTQNNQLLNQEIEGLKGFKSEASRISSSNKRPRVDDPPPSAPITNPNSNTGGGNNNTWELFQSMISRDFKPQYY
jgi:hypothetical protein